MDDNWKCKVCQSAEPGPAPPNPICEDCALEGYDGGDVNKLAGKGSVISEREPEEVVSRTMTMYKSTLTEIQALSRATGFSPGRVVDIAVSGLTPDDFSREVLRRVKDLL